MSGRFDYVAYDDRSQEIQAGLKELFKDVEEVLELAIKSPRAKALVMTKLEETYMWVGKAIRDDQIARNGTAELQEQRSNS